MVNPSPESSPAGLIIAAGSVLRLDELDQVIANIPDTLEIIGWCAYLSQTTSSWAENTFSVKCLDLNAISGEIDESICAKARSAMDLFGSQDDPKLEAFVLEKLYSEAEELVLATEMVKLVRSQLNSKDHKIYFLGNDNNGSTAVKTELEDFCNLEILELPPKSSRDFRTRVNKYVQGLRLEGRISHAVPDLIERTDNEWRFRTSLPRQSFWTEKKSYYSLPKGEICLLSSYANNSRSILNLSSLFPRNTHWIVTTLSARRALPKSAKWSWLWAHANKSHQWSWPLLPTDKTEISAPKSDSGLGNGWPANSQTLSRWEEIDRALTARMMSCWDNYLEKYSPRLVVVANQWDIEGAFALRAKEMGIAVLQVFHGATGGHLYREHKVIGDCMVIPGKYWADTLPVVSRHKALVVGSTPDIANSTPDVPRRLTFFSTFISNQSRMVAEEEYKSMVKAICHIRSVSGWLVVMRPHQLENPSLFLEYWRNSTTDDPPIILSAHKETLIEAVKSTGVALTFPSSILLACASGGVRATIPGWIPFEWREGVESVSNGKLAEFASNPEDIGKILEAQILAAEHDGPIDSGDSDLLARFGVGHDEFRDWISSTTAGSKSK